MVLDTLNREKNFKIDNLTLFLGRKGSAFYSEDKRKNLELSRNPDYLARKYQDNNFFKKVASLEGDAIFRYYEDDLMITHQRYDLTNWELKEKIEKPIWEVGDSTINILGYNCVIAETIFRGRKWVAFFSPELPLSDGPWKLIGLPGTILKAFDNKKHYVYEAIEINTKNPGVVEYFNYRNRIKITDRKKGLIQKHKSLKSNLTDKIRNSYGISTEKTNSTINDIKRYDFEETDYPHE